MANNFTLVNTSGQLPAAKATLYTVPAGTQAIIKTITVVNTSAEIVNINLYINTGTSRKITPDDRELEAGALANDTNVYMLPAGALIEGDASIASVCDYTLNIVQET